MKPPFRLALTADFYDDQGKPRYRDIGLDLLERVPWIRVETFASHRTEIAPEQLEGCHGAIVLTPRVTAQSLSKSKDLLALGRFGVGYDSVDVTACTAAEVLLFITAGAVDYSVAEATLTWMLALTHHVRAKDRLVREGRWDERSQFMGSELRGKTLGIIGYGGIGRAVTKLTSGFQMQPPLVFDPFLLPSSPIENAGQRVSLERLLREADFVSIHCPLNETTRNLIGAKELAWMKPTAYLLNTARGGIVDEDELFDALSSRQITGAALDCFVGEPLTAPSRFASLENVLLAPHCIAWTDELFREIGRCACQGMIDLSEGRPPRGIVNPEVLERPRFREKWTKILGP